MGITRFEGDVRKLVETDVSHDLLMQLTVLRLGVEVVVLPTLLIFACHSLTWL